MYRLFAKMNRQYLIAGGVVFVLVLINILGFWFMRPPAPPNSFAGKVSHVTDSSLTVIDAKGHIREFSLTSSTSIVVGKDVALGTALATSTFVVVTTDVPGPKATVAKKIRIFSTDPFDRRHKDVTP